MIAKGYATPAQVAEAWKRQLLYTPANAPLLGEVLLRLGYVTEAKVKEALRMQEEEERS